MARVNSYPTKTPEGADKFYVDSINGGATGATVDTTGLLAYMQANLTFPTVITAHSGLTGLTTGNDHTQYALLAGATFAGAVSGTTFTGTGTVQGATIASTGNVTGTTITATGTANASIFAASTNITSPAATITTVTATTLNATNLSATTLQGAIAANNQNITGVNSLTATTVTDGGSRVTVSSTTTVRNIISITQAAYDLLAPPVATTLYLING